jgi:TATA-binding protein-associated factor Taf7
VKQYKKLYQKKTLKQAGVGEQTEAEEEESEEKESEEEESEEEESEKEDQFHVDLVKNFFINGVETFKTSVPEKIIILNYFNDTFKLAPTPDLKNNKEMKNTL